MIKLIRTWLYELRPFIGLHYLFPTAFGIFLGYHIFNKPVYFLPCSLLFIAVFFSYQASIVLNDLNDMIPDASAKRKTPINAGDFSRKTYGTLGIVFFTVSLIAALMISYRMLLIVLLGNILHFIYSAPPFRLKRFYPLSVILLAAGAVLTAVAGYAIYEPARPFLSFPGKAALFIFLPLVLALNFRDLSDYEGDRLDNVTSLFTILGLNAGRVVNGVLVFLSYALVPVILGYGPLFFAALPLGMISSYFCLKKPFNEKPVFYVYFILVAILTVLFNIKPGIVAIPLPR